MKSIHFIIAIAIAVAVSSGQAEDIDTLPAQKEALAWLDNVDAGGYGTSWDDAAAIFRKAVTRENWEKALAGVRAPLGVAGPRKMRSVIYAKNPPNAPEGEYVVIQYDTLFAQRGAVETITPMKEPDGRWRVSGYFIK
jgi:hypothetical protein